MMKPEEVVHEKRDRQVLEELAQWPATAQPKFYSYEVFEKAFEHKMPSITAENGHL